MRAFLAKHQAIIAVLLLCFALRAAMVIKGADYERLPVDPDQYWEIAGTYKEWVGWRVRHAAPHLARSRPHLLRLPAWPTAYRPPFYSALLVPVRFVTFDYVHAGLLFQASLDVLTCWLVWRLARRVVSRRRALIPAAMWAIYPPGIWLAPRFWSEPLCAALLTAAMLLWLRSRRKVQHAVASGLAFGFAALTRPASLFAGILLGSAKPFCPRRRTRSALPATILFFAAILYVMGLWWRHTYEWYGRPVLLTTHGGVTLYLGNCQLDEEAWWRQPTTVEAATKRMREERRRYTLHELFDIWGNEMKMDALHREFAMEIIKAHPFRYIAVSGLRVARLWFNVGYGHWPSAKSWGVAIINAALLALAWVGWRRRKSRRAAMMPIVLVAVSQTVVYALIIAYVRFIVPVMPGVIVMAAAGLTAMTRSASSSPVRAADVRPPAAS